VLRHENAVLRRQLARVRYAPADRVWLAALSRLLPRHRWAEVFPLTPAPILAWHRKLVSRKGDYTARRRPGRPPTAAAIKNLVVRMATENPWGPRRVQGELVPLVITSSDTPHPHQPEPEAHPESPGETTRRPHASRLGHQSVIAAARSRDRDPLTRRNAVT
jgi:hypothetical protein